MRVLVLLSGFVLALPMAAAGDAEAEPAGEADCFPVFVDAIPPNEVHVNPPCAAENIAALLPAGGEEFRCAFDAAWSATSPQVQGVAGPLAVPLQGAQSCVSG